MKEHRSGTFKELIGKDPARLVRFWRRFGPPTPQQMLSVDIVRFGVGLARYAYFARARRRLQTHPEGDGNGSIGINTVHHNMAGLVDLAGLRSHKLTRPLSVIETLGKDSKILSIGPRTEGELLALVALGFQPQNIKGLDLISYSPWVDVGDMHALPYPDSSFDAVVMGWVLTYSDDRQRAIDETIRVLKPGGILAVGVEYSAETHQEIERRVGYQVPDAGRIDRTDQLMKLIGDQADYVYFKHDPHPSQLHDKASVIVVCSVKK